MLCEFARTGFIRRAYCLKRANRCGQPVHEHIYWLSRKGLVTARLKRLDDGNGKASSEKSPSALPHERAITEFHLALTEAAGRDVWWRQSHLRHRAVVGRESVSINPDALFYWDGYYYFLEIERQRQGHYRNGESGLMKKLRSYCRYADRTAALYKQRWPDMNGFYVLIVVASRTRRDRLIDALSTRHPYRFIRVACADDVRLNILGDIWLSPEGTRSAFRIARTAK